MNKTGVRRPRIVFVHFTAPPIVGGVEAVIAEQVHLFQEAGYRTLILAGRRGRGPRMSPARWPSSPKWIRQDPRYLEIHENLERGNVPPGFSDLQSSIERQIERTLQPDDIVIAHNVLTTHFNLALTAALHHAVAEGRLPRLVIWCHDISRHVNPARDAVQHHGAPWDLLRTRIESASYVAVSLARQQTLADILHCAPDLIRVISNGVDPAKLLALSDLGLHLARTYGLFKADLVILMPVRITKVKNIEFALAWWTHSSARAWTCVWS